MKCIIGVDIGGTKIASGIVAVGARLIAPLLVEKTVVPTFAEKGFRAALDQVYKSVEDLLSAKNAPKKRDIAGIGVCAPGPLNPIKGIVHNPPNLPGWRNVPLSALIQKKFKIKAKLENDANAAGYAELLWGAAKGYKNVFYVTVSTGIGTAIIIDGKILHGKNGMAGEGGHVTINYDAPHAACNCGNTGCIEALASGPYTVKHVLRRIKENPGIKTKIMDIAGGDTQKVTMLTISQAAKEGDALALEVIAEEGKLLGIWLGSMINILDPEVIVIGGGVSLIGETLFKEIRKSIAAHTINIFASKVPIVQAKLKKDVGIFGAASVFVG